MNSNPLSSTADQPISQPARRAPWRVLGPAALAVVLAAAVFIATRPVPVTLTVTGLDEPLSFETMEKTIGAALAEAGVTLHDKDLVTPALDTELNGKQNKAVTVQVQKALQARVTADGRTIETFTQAGTVGELLKELAISLDEDDRVEPGPEAKLSAGSSIRVVRVAKREEVSQTEIPFETLRQEDRRMNLGEQREVQAGEPGIREVVTQVVEEDGKEVSRETVSESTVKEPVNRIVAYGTAGVVSRGGDTFRYTRELDMTATGYTAGPESNPTGNGYTYTGIKATRGVVAVDPNVIPLHTRLYVEGYGYAVAADIGGAIKGMKIDLCFDTVEEALQWGVRPVKVYVLDD